MPELPEVETVRKELEKNILNKEIEEIEIYYGKIIKNISPQKFQNILKKQKIKKVKRRGKHLILEFTNYYLIIHLRMEGKIFYYDKFPDISKHDHLLFKFTDKTYLVYNDTRKFGTMDVIEKQAINDYIPLTKLGIEANSPKLNYKYLKEKFKKLQKPIKSSLLDQTIINGLGNIYADEVLFASKIHPLQKTNRLNDNDLKKLVKNSQEIINEAIKNKGTTVKSFAISQKSSGNFQHLLKVYNRKGEKCIRCKTAIEKIKIGGRGSSFCPTCQKLK